MSPNRTYPVFFLKDFFKVLLRHGTGTHSMKILYYVFQKTMIQTLHIKSQSYTVLAARIAFFFECMYSA